MFYIRESRRQKSLIYGKGVEETIKGQKSPRKIILKPIKEKIPKVGLLGLIKRVFSGEPYSGKEATEKGISMTKPQIGEMAYSEKQVKSYREQKRVEKPKPLLRKIKDFFVKPKPVPKLRKITREAPGSDVAKKSISRTREELRGKGF